LRPFEPDVTYGQEQRQARRKGPEQRKQKNEPRRRAIYNFILCRHKRGQTEAAYAEAGETFNIMADRAKRIFLEERKKVAK
jgi:hypothetical protein